MSTSTGTVDSTISYFPFGLTGTGSVNTTKEFTGQRLDATGLYYYNARYYDPQIGRFISPDSAGQDLNNPQTLNRYSYCSNNPLKYIDPSGHSFGSFIKSAVNFAKAHPVIAAVAVVLVVSAAIIAAPVVLSAISTAACVAGATTGVTALTSVGLVASTAAAATLETATAIGSIPIFGALATTVADVGLGMVGFGCASPETSTSSESDCVSFNVGEGTEVHGNSLLTTKPCYGYALRDRTTDEILKYGDTLYPETRYTQVYLDSIQARLDIMAQGSKAEMHEWQHDQILDYFDSCGQFPPYNNSEW